MPDQLANSVLLIEDNPGDILLIDEYLSECLNDALLHTAISYEQARQWIQQTNEPPDVILLDLSLPDHSGEQLIRDMVELSGEVPVIILTGLSDMAFCLRSLSLGVSDYLFKDELSEITIHKSILYAIERKRLSTAIRESEKNYSRLFHSSPQPMWVFDPETLQIVRVNRAALEKYRYSEMEFLTLTMNDLYYGEAEQIIPVAGEAEHLHNHYKGRFLHATSTGEPLYVDIYSNPILMSGKELQLVMGVDITEKVRFENNINKAIINAQDAERYEIGSELHDNVCQILTSSQLRLRMLEESISPEQKATFIQAFDQIGLALREIRNLSHRLAPSFFENATLTDTLEHLLISFNVGNRYTIRIDLDQTLSETRLSKRVHLNFYRILQEHLNNISQHAQATHVTIKAWLPDNRIHFQIEDDGIGFDQKTTGPGIGLANMQRRVDLLGGTIHLQTSPGNGCTLLIRVPVDEWNQ